MEKHLIIQCC